MATTRGQIENKDAVSAMKKRLDAAKAKRKKAAAKAERKKADLRDDVKARRTAGTKKDDNFNKMIKKALDDVAKTSLKDDAKAKRTAAAKSSKKKSKKKARFGVGSNKTLNGKANVSAEQLKKTGLSLRQYMNRWNADGKRPTAPPPLKEKGQVYSRSQSMAEKGDTDPNTMTRRQANLKDDAKAKRTKGTVNVSGPPGSTASPKKPDSRYKHYGKKGTLLGDFSRAIDLKYDTRPSLPPEDGSQDNADGGMIGSADMSAKKTSAPKNKKKKVPQYYKGGGMIKKGKSYAYGGRVAKYKD